MLYSPAAGVRFDGEEPIVDMTKRRLPVDDATAAAIRDDFGREVQAAAKKAGLRLLGILPPPKGVVRLVNDTQERGSATEDVALD